MKIGNVWIYVKTIGINQTQLVIVAPEDIKITREEFLTIDEVGPFYSEEAYIKRDQLIDPIGEKDQKEDD